VLDFLAKLTLAAKSPAQRSRLLWLNFGSSAKFLRQTRSPLRFVNDVAAFMEGMRDNRSTSCFG